MIDKNSEKYKNLIACGYSEEMIDAPISTHTRMLRMVEVTAMMMRLLM